MIQIVRRPISWSNEEVEGWKFTSSKCHRVVHHVTHAGHAVQPKRQHMTRRRCTKRIALAKNAFRHLTLAISSHLFRQSNEMRCDARPTTSPHVKSRHIYVHIIMSMSMDDSVKLTRIDDLRECFWVLAMFLKDSCVMP